MRKGEREEEERGRKERRKKHRGYNLFRVSV